MVGLLDLRARSPSDVTSAERRGVFSDLCLSRSLQSGEEESQCGWCVGSSLSPSLSLSQSRSSSLLVVCLLWSCLLILFCFSSDRIKLGFLCFVLIFWQISSTFHYALILCAETLFLHFEESLNTDNIRWMLSWALVAIIRKEISFGHITTTNEERCMTSCDPSRVSASILTLKYLKHKIDNNKKIVNIVFCCCKIKCWKGSMLLLLIYLNPRDHCMGLCTF